MILAIDAGNSAVKYGVFEGQQLVRSGRWPLKAGGRPDDWESLPAALLEDDTIHRIGLSSVVPAVSEGVRALVHRLSRPVDLLEVSAYITLPFRITYRTPHTLGADRIAAAAAAHALYGNDAFNRIRNVLAIDAGTAITIEVVDRNGVYPGGIIAPGPTLLARSLHSGTAQLPNIDLTLPETIFGRSTVEAIQAGVMYGFVESTRGLIRKIVQHLDSPSFVVCTGGWSLLLSEHLPEIDLVEPDLVLRGVNELLKLNPSGQAIGRFSS